tara:strand:+ start:947 stop:1246 length:300 start_codon:yes stop_codon:yes gene_type:complete
MIAEIIVGSLTTAGAWIYNRADPKNLEKVKSAINETKEKVLKKKTKYITITIKDGEVKDVIGLPDNYIVNIDNIDLEELQDEVISNQNWFSQLRRKFRC